MFSYKRFTIHLQIENKCKRKFILIKRKHSRCFHYVEFFILSINHFFLQLNYLILYQRNQFNLTKTQLKFFFTFLNRKPTTNLNPTYFNPTKLLLSLKKTTLYNPKQITKT